MAPLIFLGGCSGAGTSDTPEASTTAEAPEVVSSERSVRSVSSVSNKVTVLFFGTSLTAGYGLDPSLAFPRLVAERAAADGMPIVAVNAGLSGETSAGAVRRIEWTLKTPVDIVVIETGGNDALRALNADSLERNLRAIVDRVQQAQPTAKILLAVMEAPPNLGGAYTRRFRQAYSNVARSEGVALLPFLLEGVAGHPELNQADGVHPNERGERVVAENVWKVLKPVVQEAVARKSS